MRVVRPLLLSATLLAGAVVPATADAVLVAPGARDGRVAIAPDGTALIASVQPGGRSGYAFCRLPYKATTCDPTAPPPPAPTFATPEGVDSGGSEVDTIELLRRPADGALVLISEVNDLDGASLPGSGYLIFATVSPDNGTTWSPQVQIGAGQNELAQASLTPDGSAVDVISGEPGAALYSRLPLAGPVTLPQRDLNPDPDDIVSEQTITTTADGSVIAGFRYKNRFGVARLAAGADPVAGWTPWRRAGRVRADEVEQRLVTGPKGTFVLSRRNIITQAGGGRPLYFRAVTPTRVAKGTRIGRGFTNVGVDLAIDAVGGKHVVWFNSNSKPQGLFYQRTRGPRGRCGFGTQARQVKITYSGLDGQPRIAAATPTRAAIVYPTKAGIHAQFARGGDGPKLTRRQRARC